jgi:hypothetical protein
MRIMKKIVFYIIASILLTAIFSYSLKIFLKEDFVILTLKTMLIPCFTWSVLITIAFIKLNKERRMQYFTIAGLVCAIGSAILVPAGIYNFYAYQPVENISIISVLICVIAMSILFYYLLAKANFSLKWWYAYNLLICTNMTLFYISTTI